MRCAKAGTASQWPDGSRQDPEFGRGNGRAARRAKRAPSRRMSRSATIECGASHVFIPLAVQIVPSAVPRSVARADQALREVAYVVSAVRRIVRNLRVGASAVEERTGLRAAQLFTLEFVSAAPGLSISELAARTMTDRTSAAGMIERLTDAGMVTRCEGARDRRRTELFITAKGRRTLARAPQSPTQQLIDGITALPTSERARLATSLRALVHAMGLTEHPAPMLFEEAAGRARDGLRDAKQTDTRAASPARRRARRRLRATVPESP